MQGFLQLDSEVWIVDVSDTLPQHDDDIDGRSLHGRSTKGLTTQALDAIALDSELQTFLGDDETDSMSLTIATRRQKNEVRGHDFFLRLVKNTFEFRRSEQSL